MHWNKQRLSLGILLLACTVLCIFSWLQKGFSSYYLTGTILFTILGVGFIRSARNK